MGQKVQNLASFSTSLNFEPPAFENPNSEANLQHNDQWRIQDFCEGDAAGSGGGAPSGGLGVCPQRGPGQSP